MSKKLCCCILCCHFIYRLSFVVSMQLFVPNFAPHLKTVLCFICSYFCCVLGHMFNNLACKDSLSTFGLMWHAVEGRYDVSVAGPLLIQWQMKTSGSWWWHHVFLLAVVAVLMLPWLLRLLNRKFRKFLNVVLLWCQRDATALSDYAELIIMSIDVAIIILCDKCVFSAKISLVFLNKLIG